MKFFTDALGSRRSTGARWLLLRIRAGRCTSYKILRANLWPLWLRSQQLLKRLQLSKNWPRTRSRKHRFRSACLLRRGFAVRGVPRIGYLEALEVCCNQHFCSSRPEWSSNARLQPLCLGLCDSFGCRTMVAGTIPCDPRAQCREQRDRSRDGFQPRIRIRGRVSTEGSFDTDLPRGSDRMSAGIHTP